MSTRHALVLTGLVALAGCGRDDRSHEVAAGDSLSRELELAPPETLDATPDSERADTAKAGERASRSGATTAARARAKPSGAKVTGARARKPVQAAESTIAAAPSGARTRARPAMPESGRAAADSAPAAAGAADSGVASESASTATSVSGTPPGTSAPAPSPATPAPVPAPTPAPTTAPAADAHVVPTGTQIRALLQDSIHSLRNSEGQTVTALVSGDVRASDGRTVVPSGSPVTLSITRLRPARTRSAKDGELELRADSITFGGRAYPVSAEVQPVPHELRGRGVTAGEAEKVAAGAAVGAVAGGVITGKTKGAVIGGAVGAAGGAVVAAQTASRDVVVAPNTPLVLILMAPLPGPRR